MSIFIKTSLDLPVPVGIVLNFAYALIFLKPYVLLCSAPRKPSSPSRVAPDFSSLRAETARRVEHSLNRYRRTEGTKQRLSHR